MAIGPQFGSAIVGHQMVIDPYRLLVSESGLKGCVDALLQGH
jgi:hypothetical protein